MPERRPEQARFILTPHAATRQWKEATHEDPGPYYGELSMFYAFASVFVSIFCVMIAFCENQEARHDGAIQMYYYDLNTHTVFLSSSSALPPITTESGPWEKGDGEIGAGVKAIIFSCTDGCDAVKAGMSLQELQAVGADVAYLERYSAKAKKLLEKQLAGEPIDMELEEDALMQDVTQVSTVEGQTWVSLDSDEGLRMLQALATKCPDGTISYCMP